MKKLKKIVVGLPMAIPTALLVAWAFTIIMPASYIQCGSELTKLWKVLLALAPITFLITFTVGIPINIGWNIKEIIKGK